MTVPPERLAAQYFDGVSARAHPVEVWIEGDQLCLLITAEGAPRQMPLAGVRWPERQRHGARMVHLPGGVALHCADVASFDAWARHAGLHESWVVKAQQSWRLTAMGALALPLLCSALYHWGLPWGARWVLAAVPARIDRELGDLALRSIAEAGWTRPSALPLDQQQRLRAAWWRAVAQAGPSGAPIELHFHKSRLGPNAFALPGGHVVLTDEMVALVDGREDVLIGVLAHEAGHVRHRHGMRMLAQTTLLGTMTSLLFGDFSGLLAATPAMLGHLAYSRDFEREADENAIALLEANGVSPAVMATMFERLRAHPRKAGLPRLPIALGSHPPDDERIARFREAAAGVEKKAPRIAR